MALFDDLFNKKPTSTGGLLSPPDAPDGFLPGLLANPWFRLGMNLMANGGPQAKPHSFGQDLAGAFDGLSRSQDRDQERSMAKVRIDKLRRDAQIAEDNQKRTAAAFQGTDSRFNPAASAPTPIAPEVMPASMPSARSNVPIADDLTRFVRQAESGGREYGKNGQILEGPQTRFGTAKGSMQVLDSTNTDPGFGITPARDNSVEERARVGKDYLNAMVKRYDGNQPLALAAYNWGPGNVDKLIARGVDPRKGQGAESMFMSSLPDETKKYISRIKGMQGSDQAPQQYAQADNIQNDGYIAEPIQLLYHINLGWPLLAPGTSKVGSSRLSK